MKPSKPRSAARHLIWPSAAILLGMSFVPLCMLVFFSFADGNVSTLNGVAGYTVRNIVEAVTSLTVQGLMLKSFWMALLVTAICIVIAYPAAWAIAKIVPEKYRSTLIMVSIVPAFTSQLLLIYSIMTLMQTNGLVMTPLLKLGILPAGTSLMYTNGSVILILVYEYDPFPVFLPGKDRQQCYFRLALSRREPLSDLYQRCSAAELLGTDDRHFDRSHPRGWQLR